MKRKIAPASKKTECTRDGTRTRTAVKPADFKSAASTIPPPEQKAFICRNLLYLKALDSVFLIQVNFRVSRKIAKKSAFFT